MSDSRAQGSKRLPLFLFVDKAQYNGDEKGL